MALFRCGGGGSAGGGYQYLTTKTITVTNKSGTLSGLTSGKSYYMMVDYPWTNTNFDAIIVGGSSVSSFTKVTNNQDKVNSTTAAYLNSGVYTFTATSSSTGLTFSNITNTASTVRVTLFESL